MNKAQLRIVARYRRLSEDAYAAGLTVFCDCVDGNLRLIPTEELKDENAEPWTMGESIEVHSSFGTPRQGCL